MAKKIAEFNQGADRKRTNEDQQISAKVARAKKKARKTGDWTRDIALRKDMLKTQAKDPQDPDYRRLHFVRYADDWLAGVIGSKADAEELKRWIETYLREELQLELSAEKTLITNSKQRVRFLGYDSKRWAGERISRFRTTKGHVITKRTGTYQLRFLMPRDKTMAGASEYGETSNWHGQHRNSLLRRESNWKST
jgi:hypothetical protein